MEHLCLPFLNDFPLYSSKEVLFFFARIFSQGVLKLQFPADPDLVFFLEKKSERKIDLTLLFFKVMSSDFQDFFVRF